MSQQIVANYEEIVRRSGLVSKEQLDSVLAALRRETGDIRIGVADLSRRLEEDRLVTAWQNLKLRQGCCRGYFLGRYKLLSFLGSGGMSTVYLAEHTLMKRRVAIKVLHPKLTEQSSYLERFYLESQVTAALDHANIVKAFDVGFEDSHHFLVMEYVNGPTLRELVDREGPLPFEKAADFIRQAAEGLHHAHEAGLIHRDIKPGNLMISPKGVIKVVDLGMVLVDSAGESLTLKHNESMLGTADYLSPEQAVDSHQVDKRTDIYSLGCTFYFALTGHPPFVDGSLACRLMQHQTEEPPPLTKDRPDVPQFLMEVCQRMMAKLPRKRFQTGLEVSRALTLWLQEKHDASRMVFSEAPPTEDDTMNDVCRNTLIGKNTSGAEESQPTPAVEEKITIDCPSCTSPLRAKAKPHPFKAKCPRCKAIMQITGKTVTLLEPALVAHTRPADGGSSVFRTPSDGSSDNGMGSSIESGSSINLSSLGLDSSGSGTHQGSSGEHSTPKAAPKSSTNDRPDQVTQWKLKDFTSALEQGDLRLIDAVAGLTQAYPQSDKVADVMLRLLTHAAACEVPAQGPAQTLDPRLLRSIIAALGSIQSSRATLSLGRLIVGAVRLGANERLVIESAISAMAAYPTSERDSFLIDALAHAEKARPAGRSNYSASELRAAVASVFLKHATAEVRDSLREKLNFPSLAAEARTLIVRVLQQ